MKCCVSCRESFAINFYDAGLNPSQYAIYKVIGSEQVDYAERQNRMLEAFLKDYTSIVNSIRQVYQENRSSRFFRLSLTYSLGNDKLGNKEHGFGNEEKRKRTDQY